MSFEAHYKAQRDLHKRASDLVLERVPTPTAEQLLTASGRARWFRDVRAAFVQVLGEAMKAAEALGKDHAAEVVAEFEERTA